MSEVKTQMRGNCQWCGREHAVVGSRMAKHGYTVKHGWFEGVCSGQHYKPMQVEREATDRLVAEVRADVVVLLLRAAAFGSGAVLPATANGPDWDARGRRVPVPFADASPESQRTAVSAEVYRCRSRARAGEAFANDLEALVNRVHGTPLIEAVVPAAAAPIMIGEVRRLPIGGLAVVTRVDGARVYWRDPRGYNGWTGTQAWRRLELAVAECAKGAA